MTHARGAAFVTGGSRGIGRAIAERLAADGMMVGIFARTGEEVEATAELIRAAGGEAHGYVGDMLEPAGLGRALERFCAWTGGLDVLVAAAGRLEAVGPLAAVDPDAWWLDLETSVRGAQRTIRAALPALRDSRRASITVLVGHGYNGELAHASGYGAAQAALVRLVESLARELEPQQIPVYALYPGLVLTVLTQRLLDRPEGRRWLPQFTERFSEGKEVGPEVAAEMVAWLVERRPAPLNGRVVAAPINPTILQARLARIEAENLNVLRLR